MLQSPLENSEDNHRSQSRHVFNIIVFSVAFLFSVLFSIIGFLGVNLLTSINQNITEMKTEVKQLHENYNKQQLDIQHLADTKADKENNAIEK